MRSVLFDPEPRFAGLPERGFSLFSIPDRARRRRAIIDTIHPALALLGDDLVGRLEPEKLGTLHVNLPRLDWPRSYEPFCTWMALSHHAHGYQGDAQLNIGVHTDHVAIRLAWDTQAAAFGRFEFRCLHGGMGEPMVEVAKALDLTFRVYASAPWPEGSRLVFEHPTDWRTAFAEVTRRGVWFEVGVRREIPESMAWATSVELLHDATRIFRGLLPFYEQVASPDRPS